MSTEITAKYNEKMQKRARAKAEKKRNLAVVMRYVKDGLAQGDLTAFDECLHPDVRVSSVIKSEGMIEGVKEYKRVFADFAEALPVRKFSIDEVFAAKDKVVVRFSAVAAFKKDYLGVKATNRVIEMKEVHVITLQDGKVVSNIVSDSNLPFGYLMYPVLKDSILGALPLDTQQ